MNCIHDHQLKVPDDISIIGFDGSQLTELVRPRLSSMEQPIQDMGKITVDTLIELISDPTCGPREDLILGHKLVVRDSCRAYQTER